MYLDNTLWAILPKFSPLSFVTLINSSVSISVFGGLMPVSHLDLTCVNLVLGLALLDSLFLSPNLYPSGSKSRLEGISFGAVWRPDYRPVLWLLSISANIQICLLIILNNFNKVYLF